MRFEMIEMRYSDLQAEQDKLDKLCGEWNSLNRQMGVSDDPGLWGRFEEVDAAVKRQRRKVYAVAKKLRIALPGARWDRKEKAAIENNEPWLRVRPPAPV